MIRTKSNDDSKIHCVDSCGDGVTSLYVRSWKVVFELGVKPVAQTLLVYTYNISVPRTKNEAAWYLSTAWQARGIKDALQKEISGVGGSKEGLGLQVFKFTGSFDQVASFGTGGC